MSIVVPRVTLDKNCLIDLEERRDPWASDLDRVVSEAKAGNLALSVAASAASENQKNGRSAITNFQQFIVYVESLDLGEVEYLAPIFRVGMSFLNRAVLAGGSGSKLEADLFAIVAVPGIPYDPRAALDRRKWTNAIGDAAVIWCHVTYKTDVLLTRDDRLLKKRPELARFGATLEHPSVYAQALV